MKTTLLFCLWLAATPLLAQQRVTLSGYVREAGSQELLPGVNLYVPGTPHGTCLLYTSPSPRD